MEVLMAKEVPIGFENVSGLVEKQKKVQTVQSLRDVVPETIVYVIGGMTVGEGSFIQNFEYYGNISSEETMELTELGRLMDRVILLSDQLLTLDDWVNKILKK